MSKATQFLKGARLGMPIALGYIPVSFSFGMLAVQNGIPAWAAIVISMTNQMCIRDSSKYHFEKKALALT